METALSMTFPWAAYYTSEALELSGIVTIMFCGIVMAQYTRHNLSDVAVRCRLPPGVTHAQLRGDSPTTRGPGETDGAGI